MTLRVPTWMQNGSYAANDDRLLLRTLLGGSPNQPLSSGIIAAADFAVTQTTTASMTLNVAAGSAIVVGNQSATEGVYGATADAAGTVVISTADATNPRIDLVSLSVRNSEYSGVNDDGHLVVTKGTAAASPVAPAAPVDSIVLAQIRVNANVTSITTANITDQRPMFALGNLERGNPAGRLFPSAGTSLVNVTNTAIALAGTSFLRGGMTKSGSGLVVPVSGYYKIDGAVGMSGTSAGTLSAQIMVNGALTSEAASPVNTSGIVIVASDVQFVGAGQAITLQAQQGSGATQTTLSGTTLGWLSAALVSQ